MYVTHVGIWLGWVLMFVKGFGWVMTHEPVMKTILVLVFVIWLERNTGIFQRLEKSFRYC